MAGEDSRLEEGSVWLAGGLARRGCAQRGSDAGVDAETALGPADRSRGPAGELALPLPGRVAVGNDFILLQAKALA